MQLPSVKKRDWTLLVQGVNLHDDAAPARCWIASAFIPDARVDDLMISYATDGGGVGAHFDSYDVFLLQVHGKRRWRFGAQRDLSLKQGLPLKVLQHFEADEEWVLEPGDMLYLPPHIAHDGVAEGECMTCIDRLSGRLLQGELSRPVPVPPCGAPRRCPRRWQRRVRKGGAARLYTRSGPAVSGQLTRRNCLPPLMIERVGAILANIEWDEKDVASFLGTYLSEPKPNVVFDPPRKPFE